MPASDYFVRLPTKLFDALLLAPLSGTQWRILFWVVRQTYGWHRSTTPYSWYRIAKELSIDRGGAVRAGHRLLRSRILRLEGREIGVQEEHPQWKLARFDCCDAQSGSVAMSGIHEDIQHPKAMTSGIKTDDAQQPKRCPASAVFRRAKESSKERKKYKEIRARGIAASSQRSQNGALSEQHPAGAAAPVPGKYAGICQT